MRISALHQQGLLFLQQLHFRWKRYLGGHQRRIDFMGIGVAKAGTSALYGYLSRHPDIGMGKPKEVHYFDRPENFILPKWFYWRYHRHFNFSLKKKIYGEVTPIYFFWDDAPRAIWEYNPNIKLITILRNPIDRAYSHWNMNIQRDISDSDFAETMHYQFMYDRNKLPKQSKGMIIERGFYSVQIKRYRRYFTPEQMLFIKYEDFLREPENTLRTVFTFLGVDANKYTFNALKANTISYREGMKAEYRQALLDIYRNDIHEVERMLGWDCSDWLS